MLEIRLMGELAVFRDGKRLTLPKSRKTLALLAYLVGTGRRHTRERLCELLWELPDDPRGALRWSLSKLRTLVDEGETKRIVADRSGVVFDGSGVVTDVDQLKNSSAANPQDLADESLQALFLDQLDMPDCPGFQIWRAAERRELATLQAAILQSLVNDRPNARHEEALKRLEAEYPELAIASRFGPDDLLSAFDVREQSGDVPLPDKPSIAVLPFQNMSGDETQAVFVDGITEDLITALARFSLFFVIARNSSFSYRDHKVESAEIGRDLGVQYLLQGSVRRDRDRVRVTTQLVETSTGHHIWTERYDRDVADMFSVQDDITQKISAAVGIEFFSAEMTRAHQAKTRHANAREYFLRGMWHYARFTEHDMLEARLIAKQGLRSHSGDGELNALYSFTCILDFIYGWNRSRTESLVQALTYAQRAVELDRGCALCYRSLGDAHLYAKRHDEAIEALRKGLEINPNDSDTCCLLGGTLGYAGDYDAAEENIRRAARLSPRDPFAVIFFGYMAHSAIVAGRLEDVLAWVAKTKSTQPKFPGGYRAGAVVHALTGDLKKAKSDLATYLEFAPNTTISDMRFVLPIKEEEPMARYLDALRQAGMPE